MKDEALLDDFEEELEYEDGVEEQADCVEDLIPAVQVVSVLVVVNGEDD